LKSRKFVTTLAIAAIMFAPFANSASIGRSGGSKPSISRSYSAPKPAPSKPAAAPAPSKSGGIGGTQGSMGVRKSEVTQPVANSVQQGRVQPGQSSSAGASGFGSAPGPSYSSAPLPNYNPTSPGLGLGGVFASSLGGSLIGSMLGNALTRPSGGTTVVNNGGGSATPLSSGPGGSIDPSGNYMAPAGATVSKGYTMWNFIGDLITFTILVALLVGIAFLFYKGFRMVKNYVNKERGVGTAQPVNPTSQFWKIQRAFAEADVTELKILLGPDLVDEATANLAPSTLTLSNVSHEVKLNNPREFSVHYTFDDNSDTINQVWHYELHDKTWKLNGIENV